MTTATAPSDAAIKAGLSALVRGAAIRRAEALEIFREIVAGAADPAQIGALLLGLAIRGEGPEVIAGAVAAMREAVISVPCRADAIDTCGTGGSGIPRRNVSTAVALAVAACGVPVAKHGNRGISSPSGSADVLAALGVDITAGPEAVARCVDTVGVGFLCAPGLHPAMRHAAGPRRASACARSSTCSARRPPPPASAARSSACSSRAAGPPWPQGRGARAGPGRGAAGGPVGRRPCPIARPSSPPTARSSG